MLLRSVALSLLLVMLPIVPSQAGSVSEQLRDLPVKAGFFDLYWSPEKDQLLLEINRFNQPFIHLTSLPQGIGSNDIGLDRGQLGDSRLVQFERYGQRVLLRQLNTYYRADSDNAKERAAMTEAFGESVIWSGKLVAEEPGRVLVDISSLVISDLHGVSDRLDKMGEGNYKVSQDSSAVNWSATKSFPRNTELTATVTLTGSPKGKYLKQVIPDPRFVSLGFRHSFVALPEDGYLPRAFHPFSGYFPFEYQDYSQPIGQPLEQRLINRHRLEVDRRGRVIKPIIYYLDPGVPEPVRGALLDGARWWAKSFELAGLKGAYEVKMLPDDADPLDVRYNVIQWVHRATRGWSYGSAVVDPRTGEILKGHVTLGSLRVRQDHLIAAGLLASQDKDTAQQRAAEMALARIRQLSAHEVGHTLGLAHNFAASSNDRASVMDYPHPLITLDAQGNIDLSQAYGVGTGAWDHHGIRYGYGVFKNETKALQQLITNTRQQGLKFFADADARSRDSVHPHAHLWDNGERADEELLRLSNVRQVALKGFGSQMLTDGESLSKLRPALVPIYLLHRFQVAATAKLIGGVDYDYEIKKGAIKSGAIKNGDNKGLNRPVDGKWQQSALDALLTTLTPEFLSLPEELLEQLPPWAYGDSASREDFSSSMAMVSDPLAMAEVSARHSLSLMLVPARLNRLVLQHARDPQLLSASQLFERLINQGIKQAPQPAGMKGLVIQRTQAVLIDQLLLTLRAPGVNPVVVAQLDEQLSQLANWLKKRGNWSNPSAAAYAKWLAKNLLASLEDNDTLLIKKPAVMPPGSPI